MLMDYFQVQLQSQNLSVWIILGTRYLKASCLLFRYNLKLFTSRFVELKCNMRINAERKIIVDDVEWQFWLSVTSVFPRRCLVGLNF